METIQSDKQNTTIAQMVVEDYRTAEVFKKFGLDFCCGGKKSIEKACSEKGIDVSKLMDSLDKIQSTKNQNPLDFSILDLDLLIDHIIYTHHNYVNNNLPLILEYATKVAKVHGGHNPETIQIRSIFKDLSGELSHHLLKEEQILFPYIKQLALANRNKTKISPPPFGQLVNPISSMEYEHENAGQDLKMIRELSNDFTPPEHACNSYKVLYKKLEEFENDLHQHVHLENNILFPRAFELEKRIVE